MKGHKEESAEHVNIVEGDWTDINEKKLLRKIDLHLIPWLCLLYLLSFLDRTAIGNAKLYGLVKDIGATDSQYRIGLSLFFVPYSLFEPFSNVLLKRLRPSVWFTVIMLAWAICMTMQGVIQNPAGLYATRWFLGLAEAGLFPGVNFYLSCWYRKKEFGLRSAIFFSAATAAGAFGGLLSAAIAQMGGTAGYAAWRWIFIILGLATFAIGLVTYFFVYDFPATAKFLTPREREFVVHRLQKDDQYDVVGEKFNWRKISRGFLSVKTFLGAFAYMGCDGALYAFSLFTPTIVSGLGYPNPNIANLISVPIYVWACILTVGVGFMADRTGNRSYYNLVLFAVGAVGYIILMVSRNYALSYFAIYLAASGIYPLIANTISLVSNNTEGQYRRSFVLGVVIGWGNLNGIYSSNVYLAKDKPWYTLGHGLVLLYICIGWLSTLLLLLYLKRENRLKASGARDEIIGGEPPADGKTKDGKRWFATEEEAKSELGDSYSKFIHSY